MKSPRNIAVKALLSADEFVEFEKERAAADVKVSPLLRDYLKRWTNEQKHKRAQATREWPAYGQNMAMLLPSRIARPPMRMRL
ncbi:hypothetical protein [Massilia sp. METH4]|uniref:hypothetical protein n=1 Tax=Massilia sp. METH4 TaxID=3123041 RepID=UPI0030D44475